MKKLFSDSVVAKLRTVPAFGWVFFVFVSFFFSRAYEYLIMGEYVATMYADAYSELGFQINTAFIGIFASLFSAALSTLVFEVIVYFVYGLVVGRYRSNINKKDFAFRVRYFICIVNLLIGVLSIGYFFTQSINGVATPHIRFYGEIVNYRDAENPYYLIQSSTLPFLLTAILSLFFFEDFRKRFVPTRNQAALFVNFSLIFVGVSILLFGVELIQTFLLFKDSDVTTVGVISYSLEGGSYLLVLIAYFLYYRRLKKISNDPDDPITIVPDDSSHHGNIYDDFGF